MTQFSREDDRGTKRITSAGDVIYEADSDQDGVGDLVFRTGGVERARIAYNGAGTGWGDVLGGSIPFVAAPGGVDDNAIIVDAINAQANKGYGLLALQPGAYKLSESIAPVENVTLIGMGGGYRSAVTPPTILDGSGLTVPIISGSAKAFGLRDIALYGKNASGSSGISASDFFGWVIRDCFFNNFGDQAIKVTGGAGGRIENVKAQNSLLVRTGRSDYVGAIDVSSTDTFLHQLETTASSTGNDTGSGYICALRINGDNCFLSQSILEISETGLYIGAGVASAGTRVINVRADLNYGDGFRIAGIRNDLTGCFSYRNGQATTNTYDGFVVSGTLNQLTACRATSLGTGNKMRYGFNDTSGTTGSNHYLGYMTANMATAATNGVTSGTAPYAATT